MPEISLVQTLDSKSKNMQVNVQIITLDDNLSHPYFTATDISKNNLSPVGTARIDTVYSPEILQYWTNYKGIIVMSFEMVEFNKINTNSVQFHEQNDLPQKIENDKYNYSFICKVSKIKHKGKQIIIYCEDLGWKFLQKVPQEFRTTFIANQPIDKAFQAICEFLGVEFAYSIEDMQGYTFGADGYSIQKDGQTIETVETVLSEWKTDAEKKEEEEPLDDKHFENSGLINYDKKNKDKEDYAINDKKKEDTKIKEKDDEEEQLSKYQEEFEKKILDLFIGNTFYESKLTDNIMHYDSITVQPIENNNNTNTSSMSTESNSQNDDKNNDQNNGQNQQTINLNPSITKVGLQNLTIKNETPVLSSHNKKALNSDYIRTLTPSQAMELSKQTNLYDTKTIKRLRRRAIGLYW